jgi:hypothetical protein
MFEWRSLNDTGVTAILFYKRRKTRSHALNSKMAPDKLLYDRNREIWSWNWEFLAMSCPKKSI